jgi:hypothetical protein
VACTATAYPGIDQNCVVRAEFPQCSLAFNFGPDGDRYPFSLTKVQYDWPASPWLSDRVGAGFAFSVADYSIETNSKRSLSIKVKPNPMDGSFVFSTFLP